MRKKRLQKLERLEELESRYSSANPLLGDQIIAERLQKLERLEEFAAKTFVWDLERLVIEARIEQLERLDELQRRLGINGEPYRLEDPVIEERLRRLERVSGAQRRRAAQSPRRRARTRLQHLSEFARRVADEVKDRRRVIGEVRRRLRLHADREAARAVGSSMKADRSAVAYLEMVNGQIPSRQTIERALGRRTGQ